MIDRGQSINNNNKTHNSAGNSEKKVIYQYRKCAEQESQHLKAHHTLNGTKSSSSLYSLQ